MKRVVAVCGLLLAGVAHAQWESPPGEKDIPNCPEGVPVVWEQDPFDPSVMHWRCDFPQFPDTYFGKMRVKFIPTHVVYAVPGRGSSMEYAQGESLGSSLSIAKSNNTKFKIDIIQKVDFIARGKFTLSFGGSTTTTDETITEMELTHQSKYRKTGQQDVINHDDDEVWFLANVPLTTQLTPDSYYGPAEARMEVDSTEENGLIPFFLTVGELKGTRPIAPGVQMALDSWDINRNDFVTLLNMDPFAFGVEPSAPIDAHRFKFLAVFPYVPLAGPNYQSSPQSYSVQRTQKDTDQYTTDTSFTSGVTVEGGLDFINLVSTDFKIATEWTFGKKRIQKDITTTKTENNFQLGQPSFGYTGPVLVRVYEDTQSGSYFFHHAWF